MKKSEFKKVKTIIKVLTIDRNISKYNINKQSGVQANTIKNILTKEHCDLKEATLVKLLKIEALSVEDRKTIKYIIKNLKISLKIKTTCVKEKGQSVVPDTMKQLEELNKTIKKIDYFISGYVKEDVEKGIITQVSGFKNDYESINRAVKVMHLLNGQVALLGTELKLLLDSNEPQQNKKIKRGLNTTSKNLINLANDLNYYVADDYIEID